jgi:hypothetical protein
MIQRLVGKETVLYHARAATRSRPRDAAHRAGSYIERAGGRASTRHATPPKPNTEKNGRAASLVLVSSRHEQINAKEPVTRKFLGICQTMKMSRTLVRYIFN